ncbi:hypothetical protein D3C86_1276150 [compost metagenome]
MLIQRLVDFINLAKAGHEVNVNLLICSVERFWISNSGLRSDGHKRLPRLKLIYHGLILRVIFLVRLDFPSQALGIKDFRDDLLLGFHQVNILRVKAIHLSLPFLRI